MDNVKQAPLLPATFYLLWVAMQTINVMRKCVTRRKGLVVVPVVSG